MADTPVSSENKMGVVPVNKLLISMSLPMMISMLVQALYNIVDSIFVARLGQDALTAVSLAFPIQNLMVAIGAGTGVGVNALLSKSLGEKNQQEADNAANNGVFLAAMSFVAFLLFGLTATRGFFAIQTDRASIINYGVEYLSVISMFSFGAFGQMMFERLLQSTGKTFYTMITQGTGAVINIILDPIMIFGLLGFPRLGVTGAAVATVIGQIVAMLLAIWFNITKNHEISLKLKGFRPRKESIKRIYSVGVPSIVMASIGSVMTFGMNQILTGFTTAAVAVFGVYFKLQSFIFMPVFGLNNGVIPILSYNYGARRRTRMIQTIRYSILYAVGIMLVGLIAFQVFTRQLLGFFQADAEMLEIGLVSLRVISLSFVFSGYCIMTSSVFQSLGNGVMSLIVSVCRQLGVLLPVAYLLSRTGNINLVWWAFPIAEIVAMLLCTIFLKRIYDGTIKPIPA